MLDSSFWVYEDRPPLSNFRGPLQSEVWKIKDAAEPFFDHCFSGMKPGALVLFVDNNDSRFKKWFDAMAAKHGLKSIKSSEGEITFTNEEQIKDLKEYFEKFGWPKRRSDAAWRIVKKS